MARLWEESSSYSTHETLLLATSWFLSSPFKVLNHHVASMVSGGHSLIAKNVKFSDGNDIMCLDPGNTFFFRATLWNPQSRFSHPGSDGPRRHERPISE